MVKAHIERVIDTPIERTWELISDYSHVQVIHPLIKSVDQKSANDRGLGAVRVCNMYDGNHVTEEITDWDEQGRHYKINVTEGTLPMKQVVAEIKVEKVGDANKSKLIADMTLKAKYGLLGRIMERLIIKPLLGGAVGNLFAGVELRQDGPRNRQGVQGQDAGSGV